MNYGYSTGAADTITVQGVTTATSLKITDNTGGANRANNYTVSYTGVTGTADKASVQINNNNATTTLGTVTVAGVEDLTITSNGGATTSYAASAADATTLTIAAAAKSGGTATVTADKVTTLNVNAADDLTINDNTDKLIKVSTVNIDSQTADKTVTMTGLTTTATTGKDTVTINVKGAGKADISINSAFDTQSDTNADTVVVNASTNTGGVKYTINPVDGTVTTDVAARTQSVTGGSGNDEVVLGSDHAGAVKLDKYDTIALGAGAGDKISATAVFSTNAAANIFYADNTATTDLPAISGVEIASIGLSDSGGGQTVDVTSARFASTVELLGDIEDAATTVNNLVAGQTVMLGKTLDLTDSSSALALNVKDATSSAPAASMRIESDLLQNGANAYSTIDDLRVDTTTAVTIALASTDTDVEEVKVNAASFDKASTVTVTSAEKVTVGAIDAADKATLDFSGVTAETALTVDTANDYTVKGSATAKTTFTMSTGLDADDTIIGGSATTDALSVELHRNLTRDLH